MKRIQEILEILEIFRDLKDFNENSMKDRIKLFNLTVFNKICDLVSSSISFV